MITDVEIRQRPALNEKITQYEDNYANQGTASSLSQEVSMENLQNKSR